VHPHVYVRTHTCTCTTMHMDMHTHTRTHAHTYTLKQLHNNIVCKHTYTHICTHIHICINAYTNTHIHTHLHTYTHMHTAHIYTCAHTYTYAYTHTQTHTYTHAQTYSHVLRARGAHLSRVQATVSELSARHCVVLAHSRPPLPLASDELLALLATVRPGVQVCVCVCVFVCGLCRAASLVGDRAAWGKGGGDGVCVSECLCVRVWPLPSCYPCWRLCGLGYRFVCARLCACVSSAELLALLATVRPGVCVCVCV